MKPYILRKIDTNLYIKGFTGAMVYQALYGILAALLLFVLLYVLSGAVIAVVVCVPAFFWWLFRLTRLQQKYGPDGWAKKKTVRQLPRFVTIKKRISQPQPHESKSH
ncbi:protein of unknown function [Mariniphaga anaerophila]|uniref:DUF4133 domain-containing protein n=1 Tax=Mariniphaga anaerophila TaxID=1484053 RepID=A0A1M4STM2_9BACT|nr:DUF4133 domain-containing protein [Mariniphaga anaerophila]SHE35528.1 protein of unknown function [Mariniphaga anaerophila]